MPDPDTQELEEITAVFVDWINSQCSEGCFALLEPAATGRIIYFDPENDQRFYVLTVQPGVVRLA